jgi:TonB family protein
MFRITRILAVLAAACAAAAANAETASAPNACDLAAAGPLDPSRPDGVPGVAVDRIDGKTAMPACEAALAAEPENPRLLYQTGRTHASNNDYKKARAFFEQAAGLGHAAAATDAGFFYENGIGGPRDERQAVRLYKLAADQGQAPAQTFLGNLYANGRGGLSRAPVEAARLYGLAAEQGYAPGQSNLANLYARGVGVTKNVEEAARLRKLADTQGSPEAPSPQNGSDFRAYTLGKELAKLDPASPQYVARALMIQVHACWHLPAGLKEARPSDEAPNAVVRFKLNRDGTLDGEPVLVSTQADPSRAVARSALAAVKRCQPLRLPPDRYEIWQEVEVTFDTGFLR